MTLIANSLSMKFTIQTSLLDRSTIMVVWMTERPVVLKWTQTSQSDQGIGWQELWKIRRLPSRWRWREESLSQYSFGNPLQSRTRNPQKEQQLATSSAIWQADNRLKSSLIALITTHRLIILKVFYCWILTKGQLVVVFANHSEIKIEMMLYYGAS